jgi:hypothetical protein
VLSVDLIRNTFWVIEKLSVFMETFASARKESMKISTQNQFAVFTT